MIKERLLYLAPRQAQAAAGMTRGRCARPDVVWRIVGEEFRRLRGDL